MSSMVNKTNIHYNRPQSQATIHQLLHLAISSKCNKNVLAMIISITNQSTTLTHVQTYTHTYTHTHTGTRYEYPKIQADLQVMSA